MRFGLFSLFDFHPAQQDEAAVLRDTLDLLVLAEQLGFSSCWLGEEHFYHFGICPSPQMFLMALAQRTTRMRLGTAVSLTPFDHPLRKAEDFAMLDLMSNGRVDFGCARGGIPAHFEGFNTSYETSRERHNEALEIIRAAWTKDSFSHQGKYWTIPELTLSPRPIQKPHPPIYQGTVSPESFVEAGRQGDGIFIIAGGIVNKEMIDGRLAMYRKALAEHGHTNAPPPVFICFMFVNRSRDAAIEEARASMATYWDLVIKMGLKEGLAADLTRSRRKAVDENVRDGCLVGTPDDVCEQLSRMQQDHGIEQIAFYLNAGARPTDQARASLELFAAEVMPAFASEAGSRSAA